MATTIVTKYGSDAPAASDIVRGELAVDTENGRLYTENAAGAVVEIGLKPEANVDVTGTITATGTSVFTNLDISGDIDVDGTTNLDVVDIDGAVDFASTTAHAGDATFADNAKAIFGAGSDLQIYHDGSNSYIDDSGTNRLYIRGSRITFDKYTGETMADMVPDGAVNLFYNNANVFQTTATGINTGSVTADAAKIENSTTSTVTISESTGSGTAELRFVATESFPKTKIVTDVSAGSLSLETLGNERLNIANNGDISFYEDTGTTAKLFWDASAESLGIGTSTPSAPLHVIGDIATSTRVAADTINGYTGGSTPLTIQTGGAQNVILGTNNTERFRIDSSGNVGIGTSSPSSALDLGSGDLRFTGGAGQDIAWGSASTDYAAIRRIDPASQDVGLAFHTTTNAGVDGAPERMRIDASGNLLVGKTASSFNAAGAEIRTSGVVIGTVDGAAGLIANRLTSDGTLIQLSKNGTTVGSIGTFGNHPYIGGDGTNATFLRFWTGTGPSVRPSTAAGANADAVTDLGASSARFKDLYLSGGAYLGGTGSANKLDDYETGTWTPVASGTWTTTPTSLSGRYIKVGNFVWIEAKMTGGVKASAVSGYLTGIPFSINGNFAGTGSVVDSGVIEHGSCLFANTDRIWLTDTNLGTGTVYITGGYEIA